MMIRFVFPLALLLVSSVKDTSADNTVFKDEFESGTPFVAWPFNENQTFSYFHFADSSSETVFNDGVYSTANGELCIQADSFNITYPLQPGGSLDRAKSLQFVTTSETEFDPIQVPPKGIFRYKAKVSGEMINADLEPFGKPGVTDPEDDCRLGNPSMNTIDFNTFVVGDFFLTNKNIYAVYERIPFGWADLGFYRAFASAKKVAPRSSKTASHKLEIQYDRAAEAMRWYVEDELVMEAPEVGVPIYGDKDVHILIDHGGTDTVVDVAGLNPGFGLFTLLDFANPLKPNVNSGLVKLDSTPDWYQFPTKFVDTSSLQENRLFGQGAKLCLNEIEVLVETGDDCQVMTADS